MGNFIAALAPSAPCKQPGRSCGWLFPQPQGRPKALTGSASSSEPPRLPAPCAEAGPAPRVAEPAPCSRAEPGQQHEYKQGFDEERLGESEEAWHTIYAPPPKWEGLESSTTPRFDVADAAALTYFEQNGYVVFASALSPEEVEQAKGFFWSWFEGATRNEVRRDCLQSWGSPKWFAQDSNGIIGTEGAGQSQFMWFVRTRPRVLQAFVKIWGLSKTEELIMSFDGCGAFRPTAANAVWRTRGGWFHTDQNGSTTGSEFVCAQGLVTLFDADESTGSLAVLPGSHKHHQKVFKRWPLIRKNDFFILPRCDPLLKGDAAIPPRLVPACAGDLLIWDSRCFHCNVPSRHHFDDAALYAALESAGLAEAAEPLCKHFTSISDVLWTYNSVIKSHARYIRQHLRGWGVPEHLHDQLIQQLSSWAGELAQDLQGADGAADLHPNDSLPQLMRLVAYVCAVPREAVPPAVRSARCKLALRGTTTSHWPNKLEVGSQGSTGPGMANIMELDAVALRLIGCEGPDLDAMRTEMFDAFQELRRLIRNKAERRFTAQQAGLSSGAADELRSGKTAAGGTTTSMAAAEVSTPHGENGTLRVGDQVRIVDLASEAGRYLNGKVGVVEIGQEHTREGRLGIRVEGQLRSIKVQNLRQS